MTPTTHHEGDDMARYDMQVNGSKRSVQADADSPLLYVLQIGRAHV